MINTNRETYIAIYTILYIICCCYFVYFIYGFSGWGQPIYFVILNTQLYVEMHCIICINHCFSLPPQNRPDVSVPVMSIKMPVFVCSDVQISGRGVQENTLFTLAGESDCLQPRCPLLCHLENNAKFQVS